MARNRLARRRVTVLVIRKEVWLLSISLAWCLVVIVLAAACDRSLPPVESTSVPTSIPGASTSDREDRTVLVRAPESFLQACRETARIVGYPVPCPSEILAGGAPPPEVTSCPIELIGAGGLGECAPEWRGWVVGSMQTSQHHLVLQASPEPVRSLSRMINGPGWYPGASEVRLGIVHAGGWTMRAVYADPATNDGSIFSGYLVLVWTTGGHLRTRIPLGWLAPRDSGTQPDRSPFRVLGTPTDVALPTTRLRKRG